MTRRLINLIDDDTRAAVAGAAVWVSVLLVLAGVANLFGFDPGARMAEATQHSQECRR